MILGMAGHVDHGKTAIVRALTGVDLARAEEIRRGLTIDLGFANFETQHGSVSVIDVPGHESFISNMVAGVSGFHAALLVISAREGVQVQTIEHLRILHAFGVKHIGVVISKCDLVDIEAFQHLEEEITKGLLAIMGDFSAPFFFVSSKTSTGFVPLRKWIERTQNELNREELDVELPFRMPIDRSFKKEGHGCVVTGSVWQGCVEVGDHLSIIPGGNSAVVRRVEVHGLPASQARTGQRVALNLSRRNSEPARGMELVNLDAFKLTKQSGAWIEPFSTDSSIKHNSELHLHTGTVITPARIILAQPKIRTTAAAVLRFQQPIIAAGNQKFILRSPDGRHTLAAGRFLCSCSSKSYKPREVLQLVHGIVHEETQQALQHWLTFHREITYDVEDWHQNIGRDKNELLKAADQLIESGEVVRVIGTDTLISRKHLELLKANVLELCSNSDSTTNLLIDEETLIQQLLRHASRCAISFAIELLIQEHVLVRFRAKLRLKTVENQLSQRDSKRLKRLLNCYVGNRSGPTQSELIAQLQLPKKTINSLLELAYAHGELSHIGNGFIYSPEVLRSLWSVYAELLKSERSVTVAMIRDRWKVTRKHAIPLLEYFESLGLTQRKQGSHECGSRFSEDLEHF